MHIQRSYSKAVWEEKVGYCRVLRAGASVFVTGTAPVDDSGQGVHAPGDAYAQAARCLDLVDRALGQVGVTRAQVARTRMFVTDISRWAEYGRAHAEFFGADRPTTTMVEVKALIHPQMLIEIEADAVAPAAPQEILSVDTRGRGLHAITPRLSEWLARHRCGTGLLTVFLQHTSASLLVQENADPDVAADLERFFARLVPDGDALFAHDAEGQDDMPAHVRAALTQTQISLPVTSGALALGTWQGVYLYEHRLRAHRRSMVLHFIAA